MIIEGIKIITPKFYSNPKLIKRKVDSRTLIAPDFKFCLDKQ